MLYNEKDVKSTLRELIIFAVIDLAVLVCGIIFAIKIGLESSETVGTIILIASLFVFIFVLGIFVMPCVHYYTYLCELVTGKRTTRTGVVATISKDALYKDNKNYYYEIDVRFEDGKCGMYLFDANIGKPTVAVGDSVEIVSYENYILKATVL